MLFNKKWFKIVLLIILTLFSSYEFFNFTMRKTFLDFKFGMSGKEFQNQAKNLIESGVLSQAPGICPAAKEMYVYTLGFQGQYLTGFVYPSFSDDRLASIKFEIYNPKLYSFEKEDIVKGLSNKYGQPTEIRNIGGDNDSLTKVIVWDNYFNYRVTLNTFESGCGCMNSEKNYATIEFLPKSPVSNIIEILDFDKKAIEKKDISNQY